MYIAESGGRRIRCVDLEANTIRTIAGTPEDGAGAAFDEPCSLAAHPSGLYAVDSKSMFWILQVGNSGRFLVAEVAGLSVIKRPISIACYSSQSFVVADGESKKVYRVDISRHMAITGLTFSQKRFEMEIDVPCEVIQAIVAPKGVVGLEFSITPELCAGLSLDADTGCISGVPTELGEWSYVITAGNAGGSARARLTISTSESVPCSIAYEVSPYDGGLNFTIGQEAAHKALVDPLWVSLCFTVSHRLPRGLTINPSTGVISGAPLDDVPEKGERSTYSVTAYNSSGQVQTDVLLILRPDMVKIRAQRRKVNAENAKLREEQRYRAGYMTLTGSATPYSNSARVYAKKMAEAEAVAAELKGGRDVIWK